MLQPLCTTPDSSDQHLLEMFQSNAPASCLSTRRVGYSPPDLPDGVQTHYHNSVQRDLLRPWYVWSLLVRLFVQVFFISLMDGWSFGVSLSATFSCPPMPFLLKLEFNSCVKYHRREIILKVWR